MLRPRHSTDDLALAKLWRDAWASANPNVTDLAPHEHWFDRVRNEFGPPNLTLVHERDNQIHAFLVLNVADTYLQQLFVAPVAQGRGVGAGLLKQVCELCPSGWSLHVATANTRARNFYARSGLVQGPESTNPVTGRQRVTYAWQPPLKKHQITD